MRNSFTFRGGLTVALQYVNPVDVSRVKLRVRERFLAKHTIPSCPTYIVKTVGGDEEIYQHNETTVIEPQWKDDHDLQDRWERHNRLTAALNANLDFATLRAYVVRGVVENPPASFQKEAYWIVDMSGRPLGLKWEWIIDNTAGQIELVRLASAITSIPDPVEMTAATAADSFGITWGKEQWSLERIEARLRKWAEREGLQGWNYNPHFEHEQAAKSWAIDLDQWDRLSDEARGRMVAVYRMDRLMNIWDSYINRPKQ